jgi:hypothetical protein
MAARDDEAVPSEVLALNADLSAAVADAVNKRVVSKEDAVTTLMVMAFAVACEFLPPDAALAALERHLAVLRGTKLAKQRRH